jgi:hypothetical protein
MGTDINVLYIGCVLSCRGAWQYAPTAISNFMGTVLE